MDTNWETVLDGGADGCMPGGWYVRELDAIGLPVSVHEYGPFGTEAKARAFGDRVKFILAV